MEKFSVCLSQMIAINDFKCDKCDGGGEVLILINWHSSSLLYPVATVLDSKVLSCHLPILAF